MVQLLEGAAIGFVVGAFAPAVGRKIKSWFVKEGAVVKADVKTDAAKVEKKL